MTHGALKDIASGRIFWGRRTYLLKLICRAARCIRADGTNAVTAVSRVSSRITFTMVKTDLVNLSKNLRNLLAIMGHDGAIGLDAPVVER